MTKVVYSIYSLSSSEFPDKIRYVGQTSKSPEERLKAHKKFNKSDNTYRANWTKKVQDDGYEIIMRLLDEATEETWKEKERYYIRKFKEEGCSLVNATEGGDSCSSIRERKQRIKETKKKKQQLKKEEAKFSIKQAKKNKEILEARKKGIGRFPGMIKIKILGNEMWVHPESLVYQGYKSTQNHIVQNCKNKQLKSI